MRIAIVHYWLTGMRGGEKVLENIADLYPDADIYTHVLRRETLSPALKKRRIIETSVARLPFARRLYRNYLGFMPRALEELDLRGYDLIISSESGPAKGVIAPPGARHLTYCHSPMRYIWDEFPDYFSSMSVVKRQVFSRVAHRMRAWDFASAQQVDKIIANSAFVASRVERYWARTAEVIHPPVALESFAPLDEARARRGGGEYLFVSELVPYKRADLAIEAFRGSDRRLTIIGDGPERRRLERMAPPNVRFLGRVSDDALARAYAEARALIFPAREDFGITPLEAMASGAPVVAFGEGGARESVVDGRTGLFFAEQTPASLRGGLARFEAMEDGFDPGACVARAAEFSPDRFKTRFAAAVDELMGASLTVAA